MIPAFPMVDQQVVLKNNLTIIKYMSSCTIYKKHDQIVLTKEERRNLFYKIKVILQAKNNLFVQNKEHQIDGFIKVPFLVDNDRFYIKYLADRIDYRQIYFNLYNDRFDKISLFIMDLEGNILHFGLNYKLLGGSGDEVSYYSNLIDNIIKQLENIVSEYWKSHCSVV